MRLPIAALLVGFGWTQAAAQQSVAAGRRDPTAPDVYVHTIAPRDTFIGVSRALLADSRRWPVLQRLNHVANPRRLRPGRPLDIPIDLLRTVPASTDVLWVRGGPRVQRTDGTNIVALVGATVGEGSRVTTQAGEAVGLRLSTSATLIIGEGADVAFDALRRIPAADAARTLIDLRRGRIQNAVPPTRAPGQRYEIRTPVVTTAVRGTTVRVGVEDGGNAAVAEVTDGTVGVAKAAEVLDVAAALDTVARADVPSTPRRALLPAPAIEPAPVQQPLPVRIRWTAVTGAARYRAELRAGNGDARLEVDARPEPPIAQASALDAVLFGDRAAFTWTPPGSATAFDLEVTPVAGGAPIVAREVIAEARLDAPLAPGRYAWRVRSRAVRADGSADLGPWNDALGFSLKAMPPAGPPATADAADTTTLALRWAAGLSGDRYRVQVARDAAFETPLLDTRVEAPTLSTPRPVPGRYGVRIAIVNAEGTEGALGPVQAVDVAPITTRSWWWLAEPIAVLAAILVAR